MAFDAHLVGFTDREGRDVSDDLHALLRPHMWPESAVAVLRVASATGVDDRLLGIQNYMPEQVPIEAIHGHTSWQQARDQAERLNLIAGRRGKIYIDRAEGYQGHEIRLLQSTARAVALPYLAADGTTYAYHVRWRALGEEVLT